MGLASLSKVYPLFKRLFLGFVPFSSIFNHGRSSQEMNHIQSPQDMTMHQLHYSSAMIHFEWDFTLSATLQKEQNLFRIIQKLRIFWNKKCMILTPKMNRTVPRNCVKLSSKLSLKLSLKLCEQSANDHERRNSWFKQVFEDDGLESLLTLSLTFSFNSSGHPTYAAKTVLVHLSKKCLVDEIKGIILTQCVKNKNFPLQNLRKK